MISLSIPEEVSVVGLHGSEWQYHGYHSNCQRTLLLQESIAQQAKSKGDSRVTGFMFGYFGTRNLAPFDRKINGKGHEQAL